MEQNVFFGFWIAILIAQLALCIFSKRVLIKLIPVFVCLALIGACFAVYMATQNWAYLILILIVFLGLLVAAGVWVVYGVVKLAKIIIDLSRKNT